MFSYKPRRHVFPSSVRSTLLADCIRHSFSGTAVTAQPVVVKYSKRMADNLGAMADSSGADSSADRDQGKDSKSLDADADMAQNTPADRDQGKDSRSLDADADMAQNNRSDEACDIERDVSEDGSKPVLDFEFSDIVKVFSKSEKQV
jgi:hypothetical protein